MSPESFDIPDVPDVSAAEGGTGGGDGRRQSRRWPWLVVGLVVGVLGTVLLPPTVDSYLPDALRSDRTRVDGEVLKKRADGERLLLTVKTDSGAMLATFRRRVPAIDLLVSPGDSLTLGLEAYRPFVEDPELMGVRKRRAPAPSDPDEVQPGGTEAGQEDTAPAGGADAGVGAAGDTGGEPGGRAATAEDTTGGDGDGGR